MAITNFTELKSNIADWLNRDDLTNVIPTFISLSEKQMNRSVRHYKMIVRKTSVLDTQYSTLPTDWLETVRVSLTSGETHDSLVSADDMIELREKSGVYNRASRYYSHVADTIEFYPTPDSTYTIEAMYYNEMPSLTSVNTTNWLIGVAPDAYVWKLITSSSLSSRNSHRSLGRFVFRAIQALNNTSEASRTVDLVLKKFVIK